MITYKSYKMFLFIENGTVFDPCMGSGSHLLVALENNRKAIGIELEYKYFTIANERIKEL